MKNEILKLNNNDKEIEFRKNDVAFNKHIDWLESIEWWFNNIDGNDAQENHILYCIEKEVHSLKESIQIFKDKRINEYYEDKEKDNK